MAKNLSLLKRFLEEERNSTEEINDSETFELLWMTRKCRASMHEPDEQGITAEVQNSDAPFDNAGGTEMSLFFRDAEGNGFEMNMASLVALARLGAEAYRKARKLEAV
jgi:hypothetical protein